MSQKAEKFFDAITHLREDLVEEAQSYVFRKRRSGWKTFGSLAACMALVVSLGMLAAMPRGCGAANNDSSAPMTPAASPADENRGASGGVEYGDGLANGDTAPPAEPSGEAPPDIGMGGPARFSAQVLEILEDGVLVELLPDEGLLLGASRVRIPTAGLEDLPALRPGDVVEVSCETLYLVNGEVIAEAAGTEVWLVEPENP